MIFILFNAGPSLAQTSVQIDQLQVDLWPEFDRSDMLVIYRGTLPATLPLPVTLTLRIPAQVGQPHAVAYDDGTGNLLQADYTTAVTEDWLAITFETLTPNFQVEFYDSMTRVGDQRSYTFVWPGDYPVEQLSVFLLPPSGATDVQTDPPLAFAEQSSGTPGYGSALGSLAAEQDARVTISYSGKVEIVGDVVSQQTNEDNNDTLLLAAAGIAVVGLAIGGTVWYTRKLGRRSSRDATPQRRPAKRPRRAARGPTKVAKTSSTRFCTQCGRSLRADDRFCGRCGAPVKKKAEK
jgi:hypothetical protein